MPRVFIPFQPAGESIEITGPEARYLTTVLRGVPGDELTLIDPQGNRLSAVITAIRDRRVQVRIKGPGQCGCPESPLDLVLAQGLLKGGKMDLVVAKATELGVREIIPLIARRSQVRHTNKLQRWRKIALEAARQSGRPKPPEVRSPVPSEDFLLGTPALNGILFYEEPQFHEEPGFNEEEGLNGQGQGGKGAPMGLLEAAGKLDIAKRIVAAVGPEGGFTAAEVAGARASGLHVVWLGSRTLRADTAAVVAVASLQMLLGDMGRPEREL